MKTTIAPIQAKAVIDACASVKLKNQTSETSRQLVSNIAKLGKVYNAFEEYHLSKRPELFAAQREERSPSGEKTQAITQDINDRATQQTDIELYEIKMSDLLENATLEDISLVPQLLVFVVDDL